MQKKLSLQMQEWIEKDAADSETTLADARKKNMAKVPLWVGISIVGMSALGLAVGAGVQGVLKLHLPIGIGIAVFMALYTFWQQSGIVNTKRLIKAYQRGVNFAFNGRPEEDQSLFCNQMMSHNYDQTEYWEKQLPFPSKVIIGPDFWVYRNHFTSTFVKVADVSKVHLAKTSVKVSYNTNSSHVKQKICVGMELVVEYIEDSVMRKISPHSAMYFNDHEQASQVIALIQKHCPQIDI